MSVRCGWCTGPAGARPPHHHGHPSSTCPCTCHLAEHPTEEA